MAKPTLSKDCDVRIRAITCGRRPRSYVARASRWAWRGRARNLCSVSRVMAGLLEKRKGSAVQVPPAQSQRSASLAARGVPPMGETRSRPVGVQDCPPGPCRSAWVGEGPMNSAIALARSARQAPLPSRAKRGVLCLFATLDSGPLPVFSGKQVDHPGIGVDHAERWRREWSPLRSIEFIGGCGAGAFAALVARWRSP
jgi:hypothetical protein